MTALRTRGIGGIRCRRAFAMNKTSVLGANPKQQERVIDTRCKVLVARCAASA